MEARIRINAVARCAVRTAIIAAGIEANEAGLAAMHPINRLDPLEEIGISVMAFMLMPWIAVWVTEIRCGPKLCQPAW